MAEHSPPETPIPENTPPENPTPENPAPENPAPENTPPGTAPEAAPETPPPAEVPLDQLRLAEALIFAASEPVPPRALVQALPDGADADAVLAALVARYAGRGVELTQAAGGWQFRTAADLATALTRVIPQPRRLPRAAMETLAIIAYHQPVTRAEIEEIRGAAVSQSTLDALLEAGLVGPRGRRETPGRPALWGTTATFLAQFQLQSLRDLPRREDLLVETPNPAAARPPPSDEAPAPQTSASAAAMSETSAAATTPPEPHAADAPASPPAGTEAPSEEPTS